MDTRSPTSINTRLSERGRLSTSCVCLSTCLSVSFGIRMSVCLSSSSWCLIVFLSEKSRLLYSNRRIVPLYSDFFCPSVPSKTKHLLLLFSYITQVRLHAPRKCAPLTCASRTEDHKCSKVRQQPYTVRGVLEAQGGTDEVKFKYTEI